MPGVTSTAQDPESQRLEEDARREKNWKRWGPYLSERQWGTVREDYSPLGACWESLPHDHARSRAYRWGEDGLLGFGDREGRLCLALALWNGRDAILKERLFGLTGNEGNHGEDVKELYYYLDGTPTHSYMKALYKYPLAEFPYALLVEENRRRGKLDREFELLDSGIFDLGYVDVFAEYAKAAPDDVLVRLTLVNRAPTAATLEVLPTLWFRNTWSWGRSGEGFPARPRLWQAAPSRVAVEHETLGRFRWDAAPAPDGSLPELLFTENETNGARLFGAARGERGSKDAFHEYVVRGDRSALNGDGAGTKAAFRYRLTLAPGEAAMLWLRLSDEAHAPARPFARSFSQVFEARLREADVFHAARLPAHASEPQRQAARQAYAGLLWSKQFYYYVVKDWLEGDPQQPAPPPQRNRGRNAEWPLLFNRDVISMPDKWEYPWYAAWDLAFHMIPFAEVDPDFAKQQLVLFLREWYMHPNGQLPACEFNFSDVNPPVHAWACWRVYKTTGPRGQRDRSFLARTFNKLLLNFTWWVNRKDAEGNNLFAGGFLGLDNIGLFDRSQPLPGGGHLEQADGTAWMAFYSVTMLAMALELAKDDPAYEDMASKFFEHFVAITDAMNGVGGTGLWDEQDGFYYDQLHADGEAQPLRVRSMVGLVPLFAVEVLEDAVVDRLPGFKKRLAWFLENRADLARHISYLERAHGGGRRLLAVPSRERLLRVLRYLLDEAEFLSANGIRSLSRHHQQHPYTAWIKGERYSVEYAPAESTTVLFGGNSNWRGPVWFPMNYLLLEALERYHHFYGDTLQVEFPSGSGRLLPLDQVARELARRLIGTFLPDATGQRPCHGGDRRYADDPHFKELVLFYEYFCGDTGRGIGASHQTGWTGLMVPFLRMLHP
jgi:mannosylglycerate hydrolase MGH1-like protein